MRKKGWGSTAPPLLIAPMCNGADARLGVIATDTINITNTLRSRTSRMISTSKTKGHDLRMRLVALQTQNLISSRALGRSSSERKAPLRRRGMHSGACQSEVSTRVDADVIRQHRSSSSLPAIVAIAACFAFAAFITGANCVSLASTN